MLIRRLTLLTAATSLLLLWPAPEAHGQAPAPTRVTRARYLQPVVSPALEAADDPNTAAFLARCRVELATAADLDRDRNSHCVDLYFWTAVRLWRLMSQTGGAECLSISPETCRLYHFSLAQLIDAGVRFGRLDPKSHLSIEDGRARRLVPITLHHLPWAPEDFCQLLPAKDFRSQRLSVHYTSPGLGLSLVAVRIRPKVELADARRQPFVVTAVLRPADDATEGGEFGDLSEAPPATLEFYNPLAVDTIDVGGQPAPLARDLTASLDYTAKETPELNVRGFLLPDDSDVQPEMQMLEPYQRGKIPVVFIHGLISDPTAWLDAANELRAQPDLYRRYQFWAFRYPTGSEILSSAATLRDLLKTVHSQFDSELSDPALDEIVLITHSLGGLMAKLQITYSQDILWRSVANKPLPEIQASDAVREELAQRFFFEPAPTVRRVIFLGTPFQGSSWAQRLIGRASSDLVRFGSQVADEHKLLISQNRDAFAFYVRRSWPTTIDLLEPSSPPLQALAQMPIKDGVSLHTIVGTGAFRLLRSPSDGVVPVQSARHHGAESELYVPAWHSGLHSDPRSLNELKRILRLHANMAESDSPEPLPLARRDSAAPAMRR